MKNSTKILAAAVAGIAVGGLLGLLFAPDKGAETRKKFTKKSGSILNKLKHEFDKEKMAEMKEKLEAKLRKVNAKMEEIARAEFSKNV